MTKSKLTEANYSKKYKDTKYKFEQRGENKEEAKTNYFNQPCLEVSITNDNKAKLLKICINP